MRPIYYFAAFLALGIMLLGFSPREKKMISTGTSLKGLESVDREVTAFMKRWKIPGASVALVKNGRIIYNKSFGYADEEKPVQPESLFRIASLSKPVTAAAIFKLIEARKLSLESKVFGEHGILDLPAFSHITDARIREITIHHLLDHTAGWDRDISPCGDPMFDPENIARCMNEKAPAAPATIIRYMLGKKLDHAPGTHYAYSNFGYSVLGRVIEVVSGMPYEDYVKKEVLEPLGIHNMQLGRNLLCDRKSNEVKYYDADQEVIPSVCEPGRDVPFPYGGFNLEAMDAHGGWIASAEELAKFISGIAASGSPGGLLRPESVNAMLLPSAASPGYACGWFVNEEGNFWHTGCLQGSSSLMAHTQQGLSWVLLFNSCHLKGSYFSEMDRLMWHALSGVQVL